MAKYILTGDILHPGRIKVEANSPEEAIAKAEVGDFLVYDEMQRHLAFDHNGETPVLEE